jgi:hypothetical protein
MNQIKKRLHIIKLAISITDIETIQLQILKLTPIQNDTEVQEILQLLQAGSYAQAQVLITAYIDEKKPSSTVTEEEQAIIDEFQLFITPNKEDATPVMEIDINDFAPLVPQKPQPVKKTLSHNFDSLLDLNANDIMKKQTPTQETPEKREQFFEDGEEKLDFTGIQNDHHFYEEPLTQTEAHEEEIFEDFEEVLEENVPEEETATYYDYAAIPDIRNRLIVSSYEYPSIQTSAQKSSTSELFLAKIEDEGYNENEIEEMIDYIKSLITHEKYAEASELLLVTSSTESSFAQFMLARELYLGRILKKDITKAFSLMNELAIKDYPEALCDLGQFYENGIGTTPDLLKAEALYKAAFDFGIQRAKKHYIRLKKHNKRFFK